SEPGAERASTSCAVSASREVSLQRRQFDVAEEDLRPLGLEEDLALAGLGVAALVDQLAVDLQLDGVALAGDDVLVPLADGLLDALLDHAEEVALAARVLAGLIDGELEAVHQPELAGVVGHELGLDALGPDLVRAADVDEDAAVAGLALGRLLAPLPLD